MENIVIYLLIVFSTLIFAIVANRSEQPKKTEKQPLPTEPSLKSLLEAKVVYVIDGDTVIVSRSGDELTIRLSSIDCPEDGQEWGDISKAGLIKMIGNRSVLLDMHTVDMYGRPVATIYLHDNGKLINVNERMIVKGHAWVMRQFYGHLPANRQLQLDRLEFWARSKRVGLWRTDNPIPPWLWRENESKKKTG